MLFGNVWFVKWVLGRQFCAICLWIAAVGPLQAGPQSLLSEQGFVTRNAPIIDMARPAPALPPPAEVQRARMGPDADASLFADRDKQGLFAPRLASRPRANVLPPSDDPADIVALRSLIAAAEAGAAGYDAVVYSAQIKPERRPTRMTLGEIYDWIARTPGQNHAIGRYQFIPATLRRLAGLLDLPPNTRFSPAVQDDLADLLLAEAGLGAFRAGALPKQAFMNNLAKIWAGLPTSSGRSHYHGVAGNKATMSWAHFSAQMARIFAQG